MTIRVLLVDDHGLMLEGLRLMLTSTPECEVVGEARDGRTGLRLARELRPDVVLLDVMLPELNGVEVTRQLRADPHPPRVIGLSAWRDPEHVRGMFAAGASGYLVKTGDRHELLEAVRAVAQGHSYIDPRVAEVVLEPLRGHHRGAGSEALTTREREVWQLMGEGHETSAIAKRLHISGKTVASHRGHLKVKLHARSGADLIRLAVAAGIVESPAGRAGGA